MEAIETDALDKEESLLSRKSYPRTPRKKVIDDILEDEQIKNIIKRVAKRNNTPVFIVQRRARKILKEMVADLSMGAIKAAYNFFKFVWKRTYKRLYVDVDALKKIRPILENFPVVLIPSHKSHLDYLILSSVFHENKLVPPYIAAGVNLAFWPLGYIFRKTGAFFIRRTIGNDILYYKLLFKYMSTIIKENGTQEFFIEGGRSRNGKLQNPKLGLLTLQLDTYLDEEIGDLYLIPISMAYDRILEENAYYEELTGGTKAKESVLEVIKSARVLKSNYGNAYISFGEPISLKTYLGDIHTEKLTPKFKKQKIRDLGYKIVHAINSQTPVTPTSLVALALLSAPKRRISQENLFKLASMYLSYFRQMNIKIAETLGAGERSIMEVVSFFTDAGFIKQYSKKRTKFIKFGKRQRISLDYYKNNIIHYCLPLIFIASAVAKEKSNEITIEKLKTDFTFLSKLFSLEFFTSDIKKNHFEESLAWLTNEELLSRREFEGAITYSILDRKSIEMIASGLRNYIEAYYLTAVGIQKISAGELKIGTGGLHITLLKVGLKMLKMEKILSRESVTTPYIANAVKFINKNIIHSMKTILPFKDLEEEEDIEPLEDQDSQVESCERQKLSDLIIDLKSYLRDAG
jgi:glycerol-3-phosphate O-acyltransferase